MSAQRPHRDRGFRRIASGVNGINWLAPSTDPKHALTVTLEDGTEISLSQWQIASTATLLSLWGGGGLLRLSASSWRVARQDVAYGHEWRLFIECDGPNDEILLTLQDTQATEPDRVALIDITRSPSGRPQLKHSRLTAPAVGLSGDPATDTHIAIMLTMMRENGGTLPGQASAFMATALVILNGHQWQVVPGLGDGHSQVFYLAEPQGPPQRPDYPQVHGELGDWPRRCP